MVSIITVNYNGFRDTCEMIDAFRMHETYPHEIIVVDNGSRQPEGKEISKRYPDVKVIESTNTGFAGGNNTGLRAASGDYLFFLNNDTVIREPILQQLVSRLDASPSNGGVSPMLKYEHTPDTIQYAGFTPLSPITLRNHALGFNQKDSPRYRQAAETAALHGGAMMVKREVLERVGPMSEVFFLFYEEFDWSAQIVRAGYKLWYEPAATVYHKEAMSACKGTPLREFYHARGRLLYARRNRMGLQRILSCLYLSIVALPRYAGAHLVHGDFRLALAYVKGTLAGLSDKKS